MMPSVLKMEECMYKRRSRPVALVLLSFIMLFGAAYCLFPVLKKTDGDIGQTHQDRRSKLAAVDPDYREGEVLVKFKKKVTAAEAAMLADDWAVDTVKEFRILSQLGRGGSFLFRSTSRSTKQLLADMQVNPDVEAVSPNYRRRLQRLPNDPKYDKLWGMKKIAAAAAWEKNSGSAGVVLAVMDSGVDYRHEDLAANMWRNPNEIPGNGIDDDGNGYVDDVYGINSITGSGNPDDDHHHGSHVAGTIGGVGSNGIGVVGVAWRVKLMAC